MLTGRRVFSGSALSLRRRRKGWCLSESCFSQCAPAPIFQSHFFLAEQHASAKGRRVKTARFVRVHRSEAESLDAPPALATLFREKMGDFARLFLFKTLTRTNRAVAVQQPGFEDFPS
jgi:hypothetical protein